MSSATDANNRTISFGYDGMDRRITANYPDGGQTTLQYSDDGGTGAALPIEITTSKTADPDPTRVSTVVLDGLSRVIQTQTASDPFGTDLVDITYDADGNKASVTNPYRSTNDSTYGITQYKYDALGRKILQAQPDGSTLQWCYDGVSLGQSNCVSNLSSQVFGTWVDFTDEMGHHSQSVSDALGRMIALMEPDSNNRPTIETDYQYDVLDNLTRVDQLGGTSGGGDHVRRFGYDGLSRLQSSSNPETGDIQYSYDPNGNLLKKIDARGITITYGYDSINRITSKTYSDGITPPVYYQYDTAYNGKNIVGRLTYETTGQEPGYLTQRTIRAYDPMGRIRDEQQCVMGCGSASGSPYELDTTYNCAGEVHSSTNGIPAPGSNPFGVPPNIPCTAIGGTVGVLGASTVSGAGAIGVVSFGGSSGSSAVNSSLPQPITFTSSYDAVGRLASLTSSLRSATEPAILFQANNETAGFVGVDPYGPMGLQAAQLALSIPSQPGNIQETRSYTNRGWLQSIDDTAVSTTQTFSTPGIANISLQGAADQSKTVTLQVATYSEGYITIYGNELSANPCVNSSVPTGSCPTVYQTGFVSVTVNGQLVGQTPWGASDTQYSIASNLASNINQTNLLVTATVVSGGLELIAKNPGATNYTYSAAVQFSNGGYDANQDPIFTSSGFTALTATLNNGSLVPGGASSTMTGGANAVTNTIYDSGSITVSFSNAGTPLGTASVTYDQSSTPSQLASDLANAISANSSGLVSASSNGGSVITLTATQPGANTNYNFTTSVSYDSSAFSTPSFSLSPASGAMTGGSGGNTSGTTQGTQLYSATMGYDATGNVSTLQDAVMGNWTYTYDNMNRISTAVNGASNALTWCYDDFGNRTDQVQLDGSSVHVIGSPGSALPPLTPASCPRQPNGNVTLPPGERAELIRQWSHYNARNQIRSSTNAPGGYIYDAAGDVLSDGVNNYLYDGEGRICAEQSLTTGAMVGYIYDAEGRRVGKGTITAMSCDLTIDANGNPANGFAMTTQYIVGAGGETVTAVDGSGNWLRSNVYASGEPLATYDANGLHYNLADALGTKRVQAGLQMSGSGVLSVIAEQSCWSLPFGDGLNCTGLGSDDNKLHYTAKERDSESGNDYFGARYYASSAGRFLSPDWSVKEEPVPYAKLDNPQTLNLYAYVLNNPLISIDKDGHATCVNAPSCTMSTIDTHPAGEKGPTITFKNDDPNGKSPNQPVTTKTAVMVEKAVVKSGVKSVNINSTTGGKHAATSNHAKGRAVDINTVNGTSVRSQGASPAVKSLQGAFADSPDVRENFGPAGMEKTSTPGSAAQPIGNSKLTEDHQGHIHESSQP